MKNSVAVVVVTYNRKNLLIECLDAIRKQTHKVSAIFIVDNSSTDGSPQLLLENKYILEIPKTGLIENQIIEHQVLSLSSTPNEIQIKYVRKFENDGGAGGFYEGMKRGHESGFDWVWLMDDDGFPAVNCLEVLLSDVELHNLHAINPLVLDKNDPSKLAFRLSDITTLASALKESLPDHIIKGHVNPFNGTLLSSHLIDINSYIKKEMFIWGDEVEYFLRLKKNNFEFSTSTKALFYHPESKTVTSSALFGTLKIATKPDRLEMNFYRNLGYIERLYYSRIGIKLILYHFLFFIFKNKPTKAVLFLRYYFDGWSNRYILPNFLPVEKNGH